MDEDWDACATCARQGLHIACMFGGKPMCSSCAMEKWQDTARQLATACAQAERWKAHARVLADHIDDLSPHYHILETSMDEGQLSSLLAARAGALDEEPTP